MKIENYENAIQVQKLINLLDNANMDIEVRKELELVLKYKSGDKNE